MRNGTQIDAFGSHDWSWNLRDADFGESKSDGSGHPGVGIVGQAIQTWMMLNGGPVTLDRVVTTFNLPVRLVEQVIADEGNWLWRDGDIVSLDGA